jgi:hypothetical protein
MCAKACLCPAWYYVLWMLSASGVESGLGSDEDQKTRSGTHPNVVKGSDQITSSGIYPTVIMG